MAKTMRVPWGVLRPGATVVGDREPGSGHKVVTVERRGSKVSVLYWDGTREIHSESAYARVLLNKPSHTPRGG
jgi:hypothetical protein